MVDRLKPFFCYFGGKWRAGPKYPKPVHKTIVEPFAGSAGYSMGYPDKNVILYDKDEYIAGLWDYLINVKESEIMSLPIKVDHVDDLTCVQEAKWLIGFWLNKGVASPRKSPSKWMRDKWRSDSFWGEKIRGRIASQVRHITHWEINHSSYENAPGVRATWFVDPPYNNKSGRMYRYSDVDYSHLSEWCFSLNGQVMVCETEGSDWMPFRHFTEAKGLEGKNGKKKIIETIWENGIEIYHEV